MSKRQKLIVKWLSLALLAIYALWPLDISRQEQRDYSEQLQRGEFITRSEMLQFLETWSEFCRTNIYQQENMQASLSMDKPSKSFPPRVVSWLRNRGWHADRFFYVEQRLKSIVKSAQLQQEVLDNKDAVETAGRDAGGAAQDALNNLMQQQTVQMNLYQVTDGEISMVLPQINIILDILEGRTLYAPSLFN